MKIAYADCYSGISGDMFLGALLDAGLSLDELRTQLSSLPLPDPYEIQAKEVHKGPLRATLVNVEPGKQVVAPRGLAEIEEMISTGGLSERAVRDSLAVFRLLAQAEARVHGEPVEQVHFHEVGAVDSIVDIVGAVVGLEILGVERLYASALPMPTGQVQTRHGPVPVPAPATLELITMAGAPVTPSSAKVELVTPTGAALLCALGSFSQPAMRVERSGTGAGQRDLAWPNIMRLIVGEAQDQSRDELVQMETNIDDMNPQVYGPVMEKLLAAGALDVYLVPIYMKRNRPATLLGLIARRSDEPALARLLLQETTTLGLRVFPITRYEADREIRTIQTPYGAVRVKVKILDGQELQVAPEYEDVLRLAGEHNLPFQDVYRAVQQAANQ